MHALKRSNVRAGPGTTYARVDILDVGEPVRVLERTGNRFRLEPSAGQPHRFVLRPATFHNRTVRGRAVNRTAGTNRHGRVAGAGSSLYYRLHIGRYLREITMGNQIPMQGLKEENVAVGRSTRGWRAMKARAPAPGTQGDCGDEAGHGSRVHIRSTENPHTPTQGAVGRKADDPGSTRVARKGRNQPRPGGRDTMDSHSTRVSHPAPASCFAQDVPCAMLGIRSPSGSLTARQTMGRPVCSSMRYG